ncbi:MAG: tetratricopeptide repeat protein [Bacteriovoracaceae bacterium]|nr:tetratricopeptide repeat protein [Bacteriovoracaceae bacterium]
MKKVLKNNILIFSLVTLISCDFSSGLHKEILLAQDYIQEQEYSKAAEVYEIILKKKLSPNLRIKITYQLGEIYSIYLNNYKPALKYFKQVVELSDEPLWQVKSLEKIAEINFEYVQDYKETINAYNVLVNFTPRLQGQDFYNFRIALSNLNLKNYTVAIEQFNEMIQNQGHEYHIKAFYYVGLSYFYMKNWTKAIDIWYEYIKREKNREDIVLTKFLIANAYETNEELKRAYGIYYSILNEYPNPEVVKSRLESLYARRVSRKR